MKLLYKLTNKCQTGGKKDYSVGVKTSAYVPKKTQTFTPIRFVSVPKKELPTPPGLGITDTSVGMEKAPNSDSRKAPLPVKKFTTEERLDNWQDKAQVAQGALFGAGTILSGTEIGAPLGIPTMIGSEVIGIVNGVVHLGRAGKYLYDSYYSKNKDIAKDNYSKAASHGSDAVLSLIATGGGSKIKETYKAVKNAKHELELARIAKEARNLRSATPSTNIVNRVPVINTAEQNTINAITNNSRGVSTNSHTADYGTYLDRINNNINHQTGGYRNPPSLGVSDSNYGLQKRLPGTEKIIPKTKKSETTEEMLDRYQNNIAIAQGGLFLGGLGAGASVIGSEFAPPLLLASEAAGIGNGIIYGGRAIKDVYDGNYNQAAAHAAYGLTSLFGAKGESNIASTYNKARNLAKETEALKAAREAARLKALNNTKSVYNEGKSIEGSIRNVSPTAPKPAPSYRIKPTNIVKNPTGYRPPLDKLQIGGYREGYATNKKVGDLVDRNIGEFSLPKLMDNTKLAKIGMNRSQIMPHIRYKKDEGKPIWDDDLVYRGGDNAKNPYGGDDLVYRDKNDPLLQGNIHDANHRFNAAAAAAASYRNIQDKDFSKNLENYLTAQRVKNMAKPTNPVPDNTIPKTNRYPTPAPIPSIPSGYIKSNPSMNDRVRRIDFSDYTPIDNANTLQGIEASRKSDVPLTVEQKIYYNSNSNNEFYPSSIQDANEREYLTREAIKRGIKIRQTPVSKRYQNGGKKVIKFNNEYVEVDLDDANKINFGSAKSIDSTKVDYKNEYVLGDKTYLLQDYDQGTKKPAATNAPAIPATSNPTISTSRVPIPAAIPSIKPPSSLLTTNNTTNPTVVNSGITPPVKSTQNVKSILNNLDKARKNAPLLDPVLPAVNTTTVPTTTSVQDATSNAANVVQTATKSSSVTNSNTTPATTNPTFQRDKKMEADLAKRYANPDINGNLVDLTPEQQEYEQAIAILEWQQRFNGVIKNNPEYFKSKNITTIPENGVNDAVMENVANAYRQYSQDMGYPDVWGINGKPPTYTQEGMGEENMNKAKAYRKKIEEENKIKANSGNKVTTGTLNKPPTDYSKIIQRTPQQPEVSATDPNAAVLKEIRSHSYLSNKGGDYVFHAYGVENKKDRNALIAFAKANGIRVQEKASTKRVIFPNANTRQHRLISPRFF